MANKIIILGAGGQVGSALTALLRQQNSIECVAQTRDQLDISNIDLLRQFIQEQQAQIIVNCAAYTNVARAETDRENAEKINHFAVMELAKICEDLALPLIHISTDYVFSGKQSSPYCETDLTQPLNFYGVSKARGEEALRQHCKKHIILRTSAVFSAEGSNFVKTMLTLAEQKPRLTVIYDQFTRPSSASNIASVLFNLIKTILAGEVIWGTYHYAGETILSWYNFAKLIFELSGAQAIVQPVCSANYPSPVQRPLNAVLDCEKINRLLQLKLASLTSCLNNVLSELNAKTEKI